LSRSSEKLMELLETEGKSLFALLTRLSLREDAAEDLMQELFVRLSKSNSAQKSRNLSAYARRAAINLAFDWRKKRLRSPSSLTQVTEPASKQDSPAEKLIQEENWQKILRAVGQLKGRHREAFVMHYIEQTGYDQIAEQMNKNPQQIRALCSKAMGRLRRILSEEKEAKND